MSTNVTLTMENVQTFVKTLWEVINAGVTKGLLFKVMEKHVLVGICSSKN